MTATGQLFYDPIARPLSATGATMPGAYYNFFVSGTTSPAPVYQDPGLTLPFPAISVGGAYYSAVQADGTGSFPPIYLNPATIYRQQLYTSTLNLLEDVDPYVPPMPTTGNGQLTLNAQGEITISAPTAGGSGVTLTVNARASGTPVALVGAGAGSPALAANSTVVAGGQTASFTATNKPGGSGTSPSTWLPITCDGATYYIPLWT